MHALLDAGLGAHGDPEQLDPVAEFLGGIEIGKRDRGNALDIDRIRIDPRAESKAAQDGQLLRGVEAFDVEGRVGLGITEPLRLLQAGIERQPLTFHAGEDVIAGAVENAVDALDGIAAQPLPQGFHDRDGGADRRLEIQRHLVPFRQFGQSLAVAGEQRLVGGDDRLAGRERGLHCGIGGIALPADQFDEEIDLGVARQRHGIVEPAAAGEIGIAFLVAVAGGDGDHVDSASAAARQRIAPLGEKPHCRRPHRPQSGQTDFQRRTHRRRRFRVRSAPRRRRLRSAPQRRVARGTTLCNFSGPLSRKRRMLRAAWRMRCSFSTSAMRT